jgi:hypothetical protein
MQRQHTASLRSKQDAPNLRTSADNTGRERARQNFRFRTAVKFKLSSDSKTCEVSHRLLADLADEIVTGPYPSLAASAPIYASQKADRSRETGAFRGPRAADCGAAQRGRRDLLKMTLGPSATRAITDGQ